MDTRLSTIQFNPIQISYSTGAHLGINVPGWSAHKQY